MPNRLLAFSLSILSLAAAAAPTLNFTPQGVLRSQTRIEAMFSTSMVSAGTQGAAPLTVNCKVPGTFRWETDKRWTFQLQRPLFTGERCTFEPVKGLKDLAGVPVVAEAAYSIQGPEFALSNAASYELRRAKK